MTWNDFNIRDAGTLKRILGDYAESLKEKVMEKRKIVVKEDVRRRSYAAGTLLNGSFLAGNWEFYVGPAEIASIGTTAYVWREFSDGNNSWFSATGTVAEPDLWISIGDLVEEPVPPVEEPPVPVDLEQLRAVYENLLGIAIVYQNFMLSVGNQATHASSMTQEFIDDIKEIIAGLGE